MRRRLGAVPRRKETAKVDKRAIKSLFEKWSDEPGLMSLEGIARMAGELGLDPETDVRVLALCWRLGAKKPAQIDMEEWEVGMEGLACDSVEKLKGLVPTLDPAELDARSFRDFFKFVFLFSREGTHRTIEKDIVVSLLPIAICGRSLHTVPFVAFLDEAASTTTRVTLDQWCSFLEFSDKVTTDFEGYEEDSSAWPLLLDEYVEYAKAKRGD
ncbi:hypothetical protein CTAYLR_004625 [Chrysophaeum taylorii]|uniref:Defective in cullin neddylation protein n=1 Tax=Chrysophaeum taylorii TaxID=2483200 RepID=A0AAD7URB1_9STRA|nr:hypothetical protein CTAYLR_004625 [Chrysophaeum taylorii]